jgi:hypothetical protein
MTHVLPEVEGVHKICLEKEAGRVVLVVAPLTPLVSRQGVALAVRQLRGQQPDYRKGREGFEANNLQGRLGLVGGQTKAGRDRWSKP